MDAKLTLNMDREIAGKAKKYARGKGRSLSDLVEDYLRFLTREMEADKHSNASSMLLPVKSTFVCFLLSEPHPPSLRADPGVCGRHRLLLRILLPRTLPDSARISMTRDTDVFRPSASLCQRMQVPPDTDDQIRPPGRNQIVRGKPSVRCL